MTTSGRERSAGKSRRVGLRGMLFGGAGVLALILVFALSARFLADPSGKIRITEPEDGAVVHQQQVTVRGTSAPDWAGVYRVLDNGGREDVPVDEEGNWQYPVTLREGTNHLEFHLGSHYGQSDSITITFARP